MHWHSYQISILVHITYVRNPHRDPHDDSTRNITSYHFYISDDMKHDSYFVQHCLLLHWESVVKGVSHQSIIGYGLMAVQISLRVESPGTLLLGIRRLRGVAHACGHFLE